MGKQKRQRQKLHKKNPTGLLSVKDFDEIEDTAKREKERTLLDVYDGMQSCNIEEVLFALQILETMAWDISIAEHIVKDGIVKIAGPLLLHNKATIRAAAASALNQIADTIKEKAITDLIKDDIMTPLSTLLKQHYSNWTCKSDHKDGIDEKQTYIYVVTLLWTLCENDENAVKCVNNENLTRILKRYLNINSYDMNIVVVTMQCLITIIEDNIDAIVEMNSSITILQDIMTNVTVKDDKSNQAEVWFLKIASFILLNNICNSDEKSNLVSDKKGNFVYISVFVEIFYDVFNVDNKQLLHSLVSILPHEKNATSSSKRKKIVECKMILCTQQLILETLTNFIFDDCDVDDGNSDIDDTEEMDVSSELMDVENTIEDLRTSFPVELTEAFNCSNLMSKIWEKTVAVDTDSREILSQTAEGKNILSHFFTLRCRAYLCLNNLLPKFGIDALGGADYLYSKWLEISKILVEDIKQPSDIELLDAAIHIMRAIIDYLTFKEAKVFSQFNEDNFKLILNNEIRTQDINANIRSNMMRILGTLALNLIRNKNHESYNMAKYITEIMLASCMKERQVWIIAETIDAMMDLFAKDESNYLALDVQLIETLMPIVSVFKDKVRRQKTQLKDGIGVVSTVNGNINRFIKYKKKELSRYSEKRGIACNV